MKRIRLFWVVIKRCQFHKILIAFFAAFFISSLIVMLIEPDVHNYRDGMWLIFVSCTTIGYGDMTADTFIGRMLIIIMTVFEILLVALFSGVIVSLYLEHLMKHLS